MQFNHKTILIISPNSWGKLHVSKHHYALELIKKGNIVYFLNPPKTTNANKIEIIAEAENLFLVNYKTFFPYKIRFHFRNIYNFLMKYQVLKILRAIDKKLDIVWCFDFNLFSDLRIFKAPLKIYHPVDPVVFPFQINPAKTADIVLSISEKIKSNFKHIHTPSYFINHGVEEHFKNFAENRLNNLTNTISKPLKVGYFGNLLRPIINEDILLKIIEDNQEIEFHFWGPHSIENNNLAGSQFDKSELSNKLIQKLNVKLHGSKNKMDLIKEIEDIDVFLLLYIKNNTDSDRSNSHKLIEYLSTGKVTVSNQFSTYLNLKDLIVMPEIDDDNIIPELFLRVASNLEYFNNVELQRKRIEFALDNTYEKQIKRIEKLHDLVKPASNKIKD